MEVMGLMLGEFVDEYTVRVIDVFAMPQSGTVSAGLSLCHFNRMYSHLLYCTFIYPNMRMHLHDIVLVLLLS